MRPRKWTKSQLKKEARDSTSIRQVIKNLGLKPAGGNYSQIKKFLDLYNIDTSHFKGKAWNKGMRGIGVYRTKLEDILVKNSCYQSYKLKKRLFAKGIKKAECEFCGWHKYSDDGRLPLELDHINGDNSDNRLENLRVLCPNCHSLQPTHRGRNRKNKKYAQMV
ncbi:MAG: HNH endonuclease [Candidatus Magasanikbacteria bacterium]